MPVTDVKRNAPFGFPVTPPVQQCELTVNRIRWK